MAGKQTFDLIRSIIEKKRVFQTAIDEKKHLRL